MTVDNSLSIDQQALSNSDRAWRRWRVMFVIVAVLVPLGFVLITDHVWEDYLITFRVGRNLVLGHGLVYSPGSRVQGSTSPLGTLLPAFYYWLLHTEPFKPALWAFRLTSIVAFVTAGLIILKMMLKSPNADRLSPLFFVLLFLTEAKSVAYAVNGQECAFMMLFIAMGFWVAYHDMARHWWIAGLAWAGLQWTRPDGCIYVAALGLAGLFFYQKAKRDYLIGTLKAAGLCTVLYLPWFVFAWTFYGNPVPHTVIAKGTRPFPFSFLNPGEVLRKFLSAYPMLTVEVFEPIYASLGGWPAVLVDTYSLFMLAVGTIYWMIPSTDRLGRLGSLLFTMMCSYMSFVGMTYGAAPWYLPTIAFLGTISVSRAVYMIVIRIGNLDRPEWVVRPIQAATILASLFFLIGTTIQIKIQQLEVEDGNRKQIGLWLGEHMKPEETLFMEPLGYIGFYSEMPRIYDFPGLVAPEVVKARKRGSGSMQSVVIQLRPDWLVLRPHELRTFSQVPEIRNSYEVIKEFDVRPALRRYGSIPGSGYLLWDAQFSVLRKQTSTPSSPIP